MKSIYLTALVLLLAACALKAQRPEIFNLFKDKKIINGYTVRLIPAVGGG
jgi:hypothetical protein